ncbi:MULTISPECIES: hypothetical protein [unclassified Variovorax]|uniref:hypothetical protein n=1 Tax=unclassified Variovorax TaxID=663243 RepID=UPI0008D6AF24|nr:MULTISPECIES: hypothetical protein [unclassified Variovorax]SEK03355.1 hypothetical protein SAMN05518853_106271 [Variovorax sp. OK202]SFD36279.1 hypothetical protein SAMN05444746_106271 [Variovorax sp. OK212]
MLQRLFTALAFTLVIAFGMPSLAQAATDAPASKEPTIQQIYEAANGGRMADADTMIAKVLKDHPNSAKAHFVQAELLAAQGKLDGARNALAEARKLAPDLSFAKPEAVERLTRKLDKPAAAASRTEPSRASTPAPAPLQTESKTRTGSTPWLPIALVGLLAVGYLAFRRKVAAPAAQAPSYGPAPGAQGGPSGPGSGYGSYAPGGNWTPAAPPAAAPGMGLGSALATGAAVGVGAVVAQEAVRHWMNNRSDTTERNDTSHVADSGNSGNNEMGRSLWPSSSSASDQAPERIVDNDFGITDTSSWDDGSSSGGGGDNSDW